MSKTSSKGNRFWVDLDGKVMEVIDGVSNHVDTLTFVQIERLKRSGMTIGTSTKRYCANPAILFRA